MCQGASVSWRTRPAFQIKFEQLEEIDVAFKDDPSTIGGEDWRIVFKIVGGQLDEVAAVDSDYEQIEVASVGAGGIRLPGIRPAKGPRSDCDVGRR